MTIVDRNRLGYLLELARRSLLETGTRNRLIHVNRTNHRANHLNIVNEQSNNIFATLYTNGRRMKFKATGRDRDLNEYDTDLSLLDSEDEAFDQARYTDQSLETPLGPDALQKRLLRLALDAKTAEEEQGINILYLAIGFLSWLEDKSSSVKREAPLILVPVELVRNERTQTFDIRRRDDDITTNLPLQERLLQEFGIKLPEIEEGENWSPSDYFAQVSDVIAQKEGWGVAAEAVQLGFFSFAKLLMLRDLDPTNWPQGSLAQNELMRALLEEGFPTDDPLFGPKDQLDKLLDPADIIQVVDADASQTKVIEEVRRGSNLVVQGPPGTGKSQTITNIIAAAVHDGKTVLFMAEKMAALSVVHDRLVKTGLRDVCLELHSRSANKKALAQELERTLSVGQRLPTAPGDPAKLRDTRDTLNRIADLLHEPLNGKDYTPFETIAEIVWFIQKDTPPPSLTIDGLESLTNEDRRRIRSNIGAFVAALEASDYQIEHPFNGTKALDLQPPDLQRLEQELKSAFTSLDALASDSLKGLKVAEPETLDAVASWVKVLGILARTPQAAPCYIPGFFNSALDPRLIEALQAGVDWKTAKDSMDPVFNDTAWSAPVDQFRLAFARGKHSVFARLFGREYRRAASALPALLKCDDPKSASKRLTLIENLMDVQHKYSLLSADESWLQALMGEHWQGQRTDFSQALETAEWLKDIRSTGLIQTAEVLLDVIRELIEPAELARQLDQLAAQAQRAIASALGRLSYNLSDVGLGATIETSSISALRTRLRKMHEHLARYDEWVTLRTWSRALEQDGLGPLIAAIEEDKIKPGTAESEFAYACAEARWSYARKCRPGLSDELRSLNRHELVKNFQGLERDRTQDVQKLILTRHFQQLPRGSNGEMGIIRGEIARKRRHRSIRWVMTHAGPMVQRIKPVFLMSPISVAQFLPPGSVDFDLLVIDEASQVRPEDALGAIARARQIVVVGDQKQLPPTSFFDRLTDYSTFDDDEEGTEAQGAKPTEMESILSLCERQGLRQRMLEWHYRSHDPSLIRVSNAEFYDGNLVLPPSPLELDENYGLKFRHVQGVYSSPTRGGGRRSTNKIEAEEIVSAAAQHARNCPGLSLGIAAFSKPQSEMITEVLEHARRNDNVLDAFLREGKVEDVFVKNIENVQGDERDVILISVGYGPHEPGGRLPNMNFGPVNREGGERRLNVLFSRARVRCEVFASFDPGDINLARARGDGPRVLKRFLEYAKSGVLDERVPTELDADSPFEDDVAREIVSLGYETNVQVGSQGFRIDIGVRHPDRPGQYILAVECDGATYHSALWARERDRLRQDILEKSGWRFHRIWSTDWFYHREQEVERLRDALDEAHSASLSGIKVTGANDDVYDQTQPELTIVSGEFKSDSVKISEIHISVPAYQKAQLTGLYWGEPHEVSLSLVADIVTKIVETEGPIHTDEIARRVSTTFGKSRTGSRILERTKQALKQAERNNPKKIQHQGNFWFTHQQGKHPPVRDRSNETGTVVKASAIPPMEVRAAADLIEEHSGRMDIEEMVREVARLMGFQRVGPELQACIKAAFKV